MAGTVKYLSYDGLKTYNEQLKKYYSSANKVGVVGIADKAFRLVEPRKVELTGAVAGDFWFDGSKDVQVSTTIGTLSGTHGIDITGNAATASNFKTGKAIDLTGPVTGHAVGGSEGGWSISTSIAESSITNQMLSNGISVNKLDANAITIGSTSVKLGQSIDTISVNVVGSLTGRATEADKATADAAGNKITLTYATKAELEQVQSAVRFKGSVASYDQLPSNPDNGDIYIVESEDKTYIWSETDSKWSLFGSSYGAATDAVFGLVKVGSNLTNTSGTISVSKANIDSALGYEALAGIRVNGTKLSPVDRVVEITVPIDYATQKDIDNSFTKANVVKGLGYSPIENVSLNGVDLANTNNRVDIDLSGYATESWTDDRISSKLTSLYVFKGSVQTYGELLSIQNPVVGHTYNVVIGNDPDSQEAGWPAFSSGTNFAWDGDEWDALGGTLDLSNYYKKSETNELLTKKANVVHNHDDRYYTEAEVDAIVSSLKTWVNNRITAYFQTANETGAVNDIRTFTSYAAFPEKGVADVEYVDSSTGTEYHWVVDDETTGAGHYEAINATTTSEDIEKLFN